MNEAIAEGVTQITQANEALGLLGAVGAALVVALRLYRIPAVQQLMPAILQWSKFTKPVKLAVVFVGAAGGSVLVAFIGGGLSWPAIIVGAITAGLMALGVNESTEGAGEALAKMVPDGYKRSRAGQVTSVLLPMPPEYQAPEL